MEPVVLFIPVEGKEMKLTYPELAQIEEFAILRDSALRFVWYFACESSEFIKLPKEERVKIAGEKSKYITTLRGNERGDFINCRFLPEVDKAIKRMSTFSVSLRARSKNMMEKMYNNLESMINLPEYVDEEKTQKTLEVMEISERKNYATMCKEVIAVITELQPKIEESGITKKQKAEELNSGPNLMDLTIGDDSNLE